MCRCWTMKLKCWRYNSRIIYWVIFEPFFYSYASIVLFWYRLKCCGAREKSLSLPFTPYWLRVETFIGWRLWDRFLICAALLLLISLRCCSFDIHYVLVFNFRNGRMKGKGKNCWWKNTREDPLLGQTGKQGYRKRRWENQWRKIGISYDFRFNLMYLVLQVSFNMNTHMFYVCKIM